MRPTRTAVLLTALVPIAAASAQAPGLLLDVNPIGSSTSPSGQLEILGRSPRDGEIIVMLDDGVHGNEPWRTDGTTAGTSLLVDLTPGPDGTTLTQWVPATSDARRLWFVVDGASGQELWQTDGTAAGTSLFVTASALGGWQIMPPQVDKPLGDVVFFSVDGLLWRTNGQMNGTFSLGVRAGDVVTVRGGVALLTNVVGDVIASDGTTASIVLSHPTPAAYQPLFECPDGQLVLRLRQYSGIFTITSTTLFWLDKPGAQPVTFPADVHFESLPDRLVLWTGNQMLSWDGIGAPTTVRYFFNSFAGNWRATRARNRLFFGALDPNVGPEIWSTDGNPGGTYPLDSVPGPAQGVLFLTGHVIDDKVLLRGTLPGTNGLLYSSDGSMPGTSELLAVPAGSLQSFSSYPLVALGSRRVAFALQLAGLGNELWVTGAAAGSAAIVGDINPGQASSLPEFLTPTFVGPWQGDVAGNVLVWAADNGSIGFEPWGLPVTGVRTLLRKYGNRAFDVRDPVMGGSLDFRAARLASSDLGVVGLGLPVAMPVPFGPGQFVHLDVTTAIGAAIVLPGAAGEWNASLPVPSAPALVGLDLVTQPFFLAPTPTGLEVGHAYWLTLGP
jgi:ELWxxDGT repeat protein